jgi:hypothetical protein
MRERIHQEKDDMHGVNVTNLRLVCTKLISHILSPHYFLSPCTHTRSHAYLDVRGMADVALYLNVSNQEDCQEETIEEGFIVFNTNAEKAIAGSEKEEDTIATPIDKKYSLGNQTHISFLLYNNCVF